MMHPTKKIVESGITALREALFCDDTEFVRQMLFCLDFYLDPYYQNQLAYEDAVYDLLQELAVTTQSDAVAKDCFDLIGSYGFGAPLPIIEQHFDGLREQLKPDARYVLRSGK